MDKKNKKDVNVDYYYEPVVVDEMQKAVSFEIEHKVLRLWYILNTFIMFFTYLIFIDSENFHDVIPKSVQNVFLIYFGAMYFCLSLYNLKAASKGVLDSFSPFQKNGHPFLSIIGFANFYTPIHPIITYFFAKNYDGKEIIRSYLPFFIVWACMAAAFYIIAACSVATNKKVRNSLAADDEETEEE